MVHVQIPLIVPIISFLVPCTIPPANPDSNQGLGITFSCWITLVSFNLGQLFLVFNDMFFFGEFWLVVL